MNHRQTIRVAALLVLLLPAAACGGSARARREVEARQARSATAAAADPTGDPNPTGSAAGTDAPSATGENATAEVASSVGSPRSVTTSAPRGGTRPNAPATGVVAQSGPATPGPAAGGGPTPSAAPGTPSASGATPGTPGAPAPGPGNLATDVGVTADAIKVGHIGILSGPVSAAGDDISWAGQATLAAANDAGGVNGRKLDVKVRDDAWDGTKGMNAAKDLVEREKIFAFCCTMTVATTDPLALYADEAKVPNVGPDGYGEAQYHKQWTWPAGNSMTVEGAVMAEYAVKQFGAKTASILYFDSPFGRAARDGYAKRFEALGGKVVFSQGGSFDDPATATFVARSRAENVDLNVYFGEPGLWVKFVREAASQAYKPKLGFWAGAGTYFDEVPGLAGPWAEGSYSVTHWTPNDVGEAKGSADPAYARYKSLVEKYYPKIHHSTWTKAGYAGASLFVDTLRKLGLNVTRQRLKDELDRTTDYDLGLGASFSYWKGSKRGNHTTYLLKLQKDSNAPKEGGGMRWRFLAGPFADPVNKP